MFEAIRIAARVDTMWQTAPYSIHLQTTECMQFIDITEAISERVRQSGVRHGLVNIQTKHTTTAVLVNEHEPLLIEDMRRTLERLAPQEGAYQHNDFRIRTANLTPDEKENGHSHCKALFLKTSETMNIVDGAIQLGRWQRIFFIELDSARKRTVSIMIVGQ
jgi:secondary thiamine-phosphate synthase enzyme